MKSIKSKIVIIIIIILIILFSCKILKKEHNITYSINKYNIHESFYIKDKNHWYDIVIKDKNNTYIYSLSKKANKKKKLIKDIKTYKTNDLICIIPIYKKKITSNIYCNYNNKQVSNHYLQSTENEDFNYILKKVKKYNINLKESSDSKTKYKQLTIYKNNILKNYKYIVWDYKGIYIIDKNETIYQKILDYDLYDNIMSTIVDSYYVLFENTSVNGIEKIYYYDLNKNKLKSYKLKEKISKDSYINGVVGKFIYVTDRKEKKQYKINIRKKEIEEVSTDDKSYYQYLNGRVKLFSKSDFFMSDKHFDNEQIKDKTLKFDDVRIEYNYFYYRNENNFYKVLDNYKKNPILLGQLNNIKTWKVIDRDLLIISEDTLYLYNDNTGLRKILEGNELNYNYENICNVWKE